ncbi:MULTISPECIES: Fe2+-dependent dioxygenase [Halomonas]|uniref:Fe2+-dependent dioxygenase n=2 Tax=Halomonas TaxID=2745 RepID=A0A7X4VYA4_9GAMM|nr:MULTISPECIES: Fe2+-dependent dioxygenase [Halomonas]MDR5902601.1 Fe2+-dependent dioxygenase [Halomonas icarae]NAW12460.1 Fe2+-dependent dioxygenase [Halomonas icarae]TDB04679.1 Fe2+-dependent dioxygenase [Halomonas marinisediminis]
MMLHIPEVLDQTQVAECRELLLQAPWQDGKSTAGFQSALAKHNLQLPEEAEVAQRLSRVVVAALERHPLFVAGALPAKIFPPLFNCYQGGQSFGLHVDNAMRMDRQRGEYLRTDLSATLFFSDPDSYDGGELVVEDTYGAHSVKLPAGDLILYPASSLHRVTPVTRGARLGAFFWIQSMVRDEGQRSLLFDLDTAIQQTHQQLGADHATSIQLTGVYHNLLRRWAL